MNLYLLRAKVIKQVDGISGKFESVEGKLVNAPDSRVAKLKFENAIRSLAANMECRSINFEYLEIIDEIK